MEIAGAAGSSKWSTHVRGFDCDVFCCDSAIDSNLVCRSQGLRVYRSAWQPRGNRDALQRRTLRQERHIALPRANAVGPELMSKVRSFVHSLISVNVGLPRDICVAKKDCPHGRLETTRSR